MKYRDIQRLKLTGANGGRIQSTVAANVNPISLMTDEEIERRIMELEAERLGTIGEQPALANGDDCLRLAGPDADEAAVD